MDKLETERLLLREIAESDAYDIVRWRSDEDVFKFFKFPHQITLEEHLNWYRNVYVLDNKRLDLLCIEKATGRKIGVFGFVINGSNFEISYLLSPDAQHKGYATEAIERIIQYIRNNYSVKKVFAEIHKDNTKSLALVQKLGFNMESINDQFVVYSKRIGDS